MRAALYARVSSTQQAAEDKVSLTEQFRDLEDYCRQRGYRVVARYQDVGSGSSKRRPEFQKMLKDAQSGQFDVIVAWKSDRLSRGMYPAAALMEALEGTNIRLEAVKDTIDLKTFGILAAVGKIELENLKERVIMGHRGRARKGLVEARVKYGFTRDKEGRPVPEPFESEVVRRIFAEYVRGNGPDRIAEGLNRDGISTRMGRQWSRTSVQAVLKDPIYIGQGFYNRRRFVRRDDGQREVVHITWKNPEEWVPVPFPALIDKEVWEQAQEIRQRNARLREHKGVGVPFLLQRLVWCAHCGTRFMAHYGYHYRRYRRKDGSLYVHRKPRPRRRYVCFRGVYRHSDCPRPRIKADLLEEVVWDTVKRLLEDPESIREMLAARRREFEERGAWAELERARRRLEEVEREEERAVTAFVKGYIDERGLEVQLKFIRERKEYYQEEVCRLEREVEAAKRDLAILDDFVAAAGTIRERLSSLGPEGRAEVLKTVLDRVIIDGDRVEVVLALELGRRNFELATTS